MKRSLASSLTSAQTTRSNAAPSNPTRTWSVPEDGAFIEILVNNPVPTTANTAYWNNISALLRRQKIYVLLSRSYFTEISRQLQNNVDYISAMLKLKGGTPRLDGSSRPLLMPMDRRLR